MKNLRPLCVMCLAASLPAFGILSLTQSAWGQSQAEMNQQAARDFAKADRELAVTYRRVAKAVDRPTLKKLQAAQKAWVAYRHAEALYEASANEGGSIYPLVYNGARTEMTRARIKQLKEGVR